MVPQPLVAAAMSLLLFLSITPAHAGVSPFMRIRGNDQWAPARATAAPRGLRSSHHKQEFEAEDGGDLGPVAPAPTRPADLGAVELFKRFEMSSDTCGFAAEYKSVAWTCNKVAATCFSHGTALGCCSGTGSPPCSSTIISTCVDYTKDVTRSCATGQLCCASASPSCYTWRFSSSTAPDKTYSAFNCFPTGGTGTLKDQPPQLTQSTSSGGDKGSKPSTPNLNPSTSSQTSSSTSSTSSTAASSTTAAAAAGSGDGGSSGNNTGAIVGGVVGGVAVIALAGLAILWMVVRNRRKRDAAPASSAPPSMPVSSPPMGQHSPHNSYGPQDLVPAQGQDPGYLASMHQYMSAEQKPPEHGAPYPASVPQQHYSGVPQEGAWAGHTPPHGYGQGLHPPPASHRQSNSPTVLSELGTSNSVGTQGNRAELGSGMGHR